MAHGRRWLIGVVFAAAVVVAVALILIAAGEQPSLAQDLIMYVDFEAPGPTHDGTSWETAFTGLQAALDAAGAGDEIWVAAGVYTPTWQFDAADPRSATFQMLNGVAIYGGFDPSAGAVAFDDRNWVLHETILSGNIGDEGIDLDNSYHVFYHPDGTDLDNSALLDGFTITGGTAFLFDEHPHRLGGGMYNSNSSPALGNVTFEGNSAGDGGGMYNDDASSPTLTNCTFAGNSAGDGGGMTNYSSSSPALHDCSFQGNTATSDGGAMHNVGSHPVLADCTFSDNSAGGSGGGMHNTGDADPTLTNCTFQRNTAGTEGGGMHNDGSSPTLTGCTFSENAADAGGGIYNGESQPELTNCTFAGNSANSGGGMHNDGSSPVLVNCTFSGNSAAGNGGGLRNTRFSSPTLTNCTFQGNRATNGGAIHNYENSSPTLTNCILWGDSSPEIENLISSTAYVTFSDIKGGYVYPGTGNINEDPLFVDPDSGNLHLGPGSPCIDTGTDEALYLPAYDFEGDDRTMDGDRDGTATVDMGVDEALWLRGFLPLVLRE